MRRGHGGFHAPGARGAVVKDIGLMYNAATAMRTLVLVLSGDRSLWRIEPRARGRQIDAARQCAKDRLTDLALTFDERSDYYRRAAEQARAAGEAQDSHSDLANLLHWANEWDAVAEQPAYETEAAFRARVASNAWPAQLQHGLDANGWYDYRTVRVRWSEDESITYRFDGELDGQIDRHGKRRCALARANEILSLHASGFDVASQIAAATRMEPIP